MTSKKEPVVPEEAAQKPIARRTSARDKDGRIKTLGQTLLLTVIRGEVGVRAPRRGRWIEQELKLSTKDSVSSWKHARSRPNVANAIGLEALVGIPVDAWLTEEERATVAQATATGRRIAAEPPPNPKLHRRKKKGIDVFIDPRQMSIDDVIEKPAKPVDDQQPIAPAGDAPAEEENWFDSY